MDKFLTVVVLFSLVLAVTSESEETKRANSCATRVGHGKSACRNNTSFLKRFYDAYKRGQTDTVVPQERGWEDLEAEKRAEDEATLDEKLRLLRELLAELDLYENDMK